MNILFLNPPFFKHYSRTSRSPAVTKGGTLYYPIWLAYAAGIAERSGHRIKLFDAPAKGTSLLDIFRLLGDFIPDLTVIDTSTPSIYNDINVASEIKDRFPKTFIILVGTHPSALPIETLNLSNKLDAVAIGEYDYTIKDLADNMALDKVKGIYYKKNGEIFQNEIREKISDLDHIPFVSSVYKKYLNYKDYFFAAANYPIIMIITGRGCPYRCFFCVYPQVFHGRKYRTRSPENVVDEMEYIIANFSDIKEIGIEDDCFTGNPKRVSEICSLIISRKIKIKWYCNVRGNLEYELLSHMKAAGCRLVTVGFESSCQHILNNMNKGEKVERYYSFIKNAKKAGILVHGCIMVGNPGDTKETLRLGYEFAKKINCDSMQFYPLYVYPGTEAYNWAERNSYLKTKDFSKWLTKDGSHNCVLNTPALSSDEMLYLCDYYLKKYHLRPKYIASKLLQAILNPSEGYRSLKSAKTFFLKLIQDK
ncbi:MAG: radical SAM protein [Desulfobacterales bacterium]|nr:radical SAM protein [Desulfobacterales bacterium]